MYATKREPRVVMGMRKRSAQAQPIMMLRETRFMSRDEIMRELKCRR